MKKFIAKATILARMAAMRLNRPLATKTRTDEKSLEASIRAVDLLKRFVDILEIAQVIHHKTLIPSIGKLVGATEDEIAKAGNNAKQNQGILKPIERIHNLHEEEWRILKPGKERETRHLRWRK
ncbi:hypothetical protein BBOV_II005805 [Babesia bovis T2Bo]|uniref:hypothetical protein n=1 Tax=Babesia bovis T2Bo TaxID=484906 RepID=UPI001C36C4FF|nr:hypothetical protein BBOV_II005805 [Babesia bovis T2Bo]KAG6440141.1 hypothetical protein BBOV_II005805 [Babesia bovis T2Bo]